MSLLCTNPSLVRVRETLSYTCIAVKPRFPELSNFGSPPAKLGVYSIKLIAEKAPDPLFRSKLESLRYKESGGGSNKPLKYLLVMAEYYYPWFKAGASGSPECDKSRIYDFAGTSIEHIYPRNANPNRNVHDVSLEPLKNSLGNLTILDPAQNNTGDNDPFAVKKPIYEASSIALTREEVATKPSWDAQQINEHQNLIVDIAMRVFYP